MSICCHGYNFKKLSSRHSCAIVHEIKERIYVQLPCKHPYWHRSFELGDEN